MLRLNNLPSSQLLPAACCLLIALIWFISHFAFLLSNWQVLCGFNKTNLRLVINLVSVSFLSEGGAQVQKTSQWLFTMSKHWLKHFTNESRVSIRYSQSIQISICISSNEIALKRILFNNKHVNNMCREHVNYSVDLFNALTWLFIPVFFLFLPLSFNLHFIRYWLINSILRINSKINFFFFCLNRKIK